MFDFTWLNSFEVTSSRMFRGTHKPKATVFRIAKDLGKSTDFLTGTVSILFFVMLKASQIQIPERGRPQNITWNFDIFQVVKKYNNKSHTIRTVYYKNKTFNHQHKIITRNCLRINRKNKSTTLSNLLQNSNKNRRKGQNRYFQHKNT